MRSLAHALGHRYAKARLSTFEVYEPDKQKPVLDRLTEFAERMPELLADGGGLMLFGNPGTGKDHLCAALLKIAVGRHNLSAKWFDANDLFDRILFAIKTYDATVLKCLLADLREPQILAISDPQPPRGDLSDAQVRRLRDVIDARYRKGVSTWITTNLDTKAQAEAMLTEPVLDRLKDTGGQVFCDWTSYRQRRGAKW